ncbi:MAG TPA: hypothetical protein VH062_17305 [Polyangiaceae bacterium]|nr:hypothetical protein [Polyangiaceae bacterium]
MLTLLACSAAGCGDNAGAKPTGNGGAAGTANGGAAGTASGGAGAGASGGAGGAANGGSGATCTDSSRSCNSGVLSGCEDGAMKTVSCDQQCVSDGFGTAGNQCGKDPTRCGCGKTTDSACTDGANALCACLDAAPACKGTAILDLYTRCHRDPGSEEATIMKCFAQYKSGDMVACNSAITACGSTTSSACTADADCGHCERCERSTGKCLTRIACD